MRGTGMGMMGAGTIECGSCLRLRSPLKFYFLSPFIFVLVSFFPLAFPASPYPSFPSNPSRFIPFLWFLVCSTIFFAVVLSSSSNSFRCQSSYLYLGHSYTAVQYLGPRVLQSCVNSEAVFLCTTL
jgi:hypothetical protein